jgi:hypothetical protein
MFDSTRLRRRLGLFASSSLVAAGAIIGAGAVSLTPATAMAADECGSPAANGLADDVLVCAPGTYPTGIVYPTTAGDLTLAFDETAAGAVVTTTGGVQVNGLLGDNITLIRTLGAAGSEGTGDLTVVNTAGNGVTVLSPDSDITIDLTDVDTGDTAMSITGSTNGLVAISGAGNVSVTLSNGTVTGEAGNGVAVAAGPAGAAVVNLGGATVNATNTGAGNNAYGVSVTGGTVNVTGTGAVNATAGNFAIGVYASSPGAIVINQTGPITSTATTGYAWGVYAINTGGTSINITTGSITVNQAGGVLGGGKGISAYTTGAVTINSGAITTSGLYADGIFVGGVFGIAGDTTIVTTGAITTTGAESDGIDVGSQGTVSITSAAITTSGANSNAIEAVSDLSTVTVTTNGAITANGTGSTGILASGQTGVTISTVGAVTANVNAINSTVTGAGNGLINIGAASVVRAPGTSGANAAVQVQTLAGNITSINNAGTIRSTNATVAGAAGDLAIQGGGGSVNVNNTGRIDGRVNFAALTGTDRAQINVSGAGNWHFTGTSTLSGGNDLVTNSGLIASSGTATLDFAGDTGTAPRDVFTNSGRLVAGETTGASTLTLSGLETFNNSGSIFFGSLNGTSSDGQTNDRIVMTATTGGTSFVGSGTGTLFMDANLGVTAQANCAAAVVADCLSIPGGTVSGTSRIRITNTNTGPGGLNTAGIVLVDAGPTGTIGSGVFTLDTASTGYVTRGGAGALDTGFFFYRLAPLGAGQVGLVSAPDAESFEFVQFGSAASEIWHLTTGTWFDRQADLRVALDSGDRGGGWVRMFGDRLEREESASFTSGGTTFAFDTGYEQNTAGVIGGLDLIGGAGDGSGWLAGVSVGYVDSDVKFNETSSLLSLSGLTAGVYGSYVSASGFYVDANVSGNWLDADYSVPNITPGLSYVEAGGVDTWGVQVETGWRFGFGETAFIEPMATLSWASTSFDEMDIPGGSVEFDDIDSLRGSIGLRTGMTFQMAGFQVQPSVYGRYWNEFEGDEGTTVNNTGTPLLVQDDFGGAWGDVGGQLNVFSDGGLTAFVNAGYRWNDDISGTTAKVGFRFQF